jgi:hypothetical protein
MTRFVIKKIQSSINIVNNSKELGCMCYEICRHSFLSLSGRRSKLETEVGMACEREPLVVVETDQTWKVDILDMMKRVDRTSPYAGKSRWQGITTNDCTMYCR